MITYHSVDVCLRSVRGGGQEGDVQRSDIHADAAAHTSLQILWRNPSKTSITQHMFMEVKPPSQTRALSDSSRELVGSRLSCATSPHQYTDLTLVFHTLVSNNTHLLLNIDEEVGCRGQQTFINQAPCVETSTQPSRRAARVRDGVYVLVDRMRFTPPPC